LTRTGLANPRGRAEMKRSPLQKPLQCAWSNFRVNSKESVLCRSGGTGRRTGLKIPHPSLGMRVRPPPPAPQFAPGAAACVAKICRRPVGYSNRGPHDAGRKSALVIAIRSLPPPRNVARATSAFLVQSPAAISAKTRISISWSISSGAGHYWISRAGGSTLRPSSDARSTSFPAVGLNPA
jgi:hypothetical protein